MKRLLLVPLAGVLVIVAAVALLRDSALAAGPVYAGGGRTGNSQPIEVGVPYSFGYLLRNEGEQPAILERVRVLGITGPIEVLDVMARPHPSGPKPGLFMAAFGFPPPDYPAMPLADEHVVPLGRTFSAGGTPNEGLQLVVGVRSTGPGVGRIRGVEFTYRLGGKQYRNAYDGNGFLCAPKAEYLDGAPKFDECPRPLDTYRWDDRSAEFRVRASTRQ